ncbi:katanin p80 WD40 repeat-containing subunit B1-like isoform X2 [Orbicella faveolata]|uniref:katanin p80 WD40 repeat-containing subunit B1-like isoform X2 n=1 Tax=Orbicella faveolata TaxID=48498 RepID=UPI0009E4960F|nr:katanin p80 WD40 repeat-containing subunit B1-like isoform X2 [Orbicella faveolata]
MAENKESKSGYDVGFFYYDWALSRYRWMDGNCFTKVSGFEPVKNMACSSSEVKAQEMVKDDPQSSGSQDNQSLERKEPIGAEMKKPLQDKDVNQLPPRSRISFRRHSQEDLHTQVIISRKGATVVKSQSLCSLQPQNEAQEIERGHGTMINVLQTRLLRLRAAQTLWHKDTNALIEYLLRLKDDSVVVDIMPFLTSRVREVSPEGHALSMGACLEMLPALERLLTSKFEDYIIAGLNMIREMIKRWWMQLKAATNKGIEPEWQRCSRSVSGLYMAIVSLSTIIVKLSKRKGRVGEKALMKAGRGIYDCGDVSVTTARSVRSKN